VFNKNGSKYIIYKFVENTVMVNYKRKKHKSIGANAVNYIINVLDGIVE